MKPTIYIGLGGTGINAISHVKKMYEDTFGVGNIPPHIAFLVLDYDSYAYTSPSLSTSMEADAVPLLQYNRNPREYYKAHVENGAFNWMFESNTNSLITNKVCFVRTTGRFYTELFKDTIEQALHARWQQVTNFMYMMNGDVHTNINIHIVTSLCGGTGAGSFINVAEMIQRNFGNRANIIGHGVMHGIFRAMNPCPTRRPFHHINAYSSILDLDYLMSASMDNPITFEINGAERTLTRPIFNEFFAIDNRTPNGFIVNDINTLCKNIAVYLFADNLNSQNIGLGAEWFNGMYNILNKNGWVQSLGSFQIVYKGEDLSDIFANRYAEKLIGKMLQGSSSAQETTMEWIASAGLEKDMIINRISNTSCIYSFGGPNTNIQDTINVTTDIINSYVNNLNGINREGVITSLIDELRYLLKHKIEELLREGKVINTRLFLESLICIMRNLSYEITTEAIDLRNNKFADCSRHLDMMMNEYAIRGSSFFGVILRHRLQQLLNDINHLAKEKLKFTYEIKFREIAVEALTTFIEHITAELKRIDELTHMLHYLRNDYIKKANECMHPKENVFEFDLSATERANINIYDEEIDLQRFCETLNSPLLEMNAEYDLKPAINDFAKSRPQAIEYREKHLVDVINNMSDEDFKLLKDKILRFSSPLLQINNRGQKNNFEMTPSEIMNHTYTFYYHEGDNNRLINSFQGNIMADFVQHKFGLLHQKMFVTKKGTAIIPYCIDSLDEITQDAYEREVRNSSSGQTFNPHFDKTLFEEMRKKNFRLKPEDTDSPEDIPNA